MPTVTAHSLAELTRIARRFAVPAELPIDFDARPYSRVTIHRDEAIEIVVICFGPGQTSSVHDHQGSSCVVRLVTGRLLELLFDRDAGELTLADHRYLSPGDVSGLDGRQVHQLANLDPAGSVLINFYSPPFRM